MTTYPCRLREPAAAAVLRELDALGIIASDHFTERAGEISVTLDDDEIAELTARGLAVDRGPALKVRADRDDVGSPGAPPVDIASGFVTGYMDAVEIEARITALAAAFPAWCTVLKLPATTAGYDGSFAAAAGPATVLGLRITADPTVRTRPGFLVLGGTHAAEWMNPLIALEFAEQLLHNVDPASADPGVMAITRIVTEGDVIVIPAVNPDGLNFSVHDNPGWRKNRRPNAGFPTCSGVDDNRNYEVYFGGAGSSASPCDGVYRGAEAFSEAETQNIRWVLEEFPNILVGVDLHSSGQQILRPGPSGGTHIAALPVSAGDDAVYASLEATLQAAIAAVNGATYSLGSTSNHAGTSDEYMFFAHRVFGFNTECGTDFQPAWGDAVPVISEVVTGLRALAVATLDLASTTVTPLEAVQCVDRTGSMIAFGYDGPARANARRFIDLMSLGDSTGVVSFADPAADPSATPVNDRSRVEFPVTLLDDPGDAGSARAAVSGIVFGGWTPIGAGLQRSVAMLNAAAPRRAILLLSDGYENRAPTVASVLASWPADARVFTIALGPAADAVLLQQIATQTGGIFQSSPTALDLHLIYNQMRADMADEGMILNRLVPAGEPMSEHEVDVEPAADRLTVTVSAGDDHPPRVSILAPSGREVRHTDFGVRTIRGTGYVLHEIDRPVPGRWRVCIEDQRSPCVVAALLASPLRIEIAFRRHDGREAFTEVAARASFAGTPLVMPQICARSRLVPRVALPKELSRVPESEWARFAGRLAATTKTVNAQAKRMTAWAGGRALLPPGLSRVELRIEGCLPGGARFRRAALRTVQG